MTMYMLQCDQHYVFDGAGVPDCPGVESSVAVPETLLDLTYEQVAELSTAVITVFVIAYAMKILIRFVNGSNPGRN